MLVIPVNRVVDPKRIIEKGRAEEEEERPKESLTPQKIPVLIHNNVGAIFGWCYVPI
jgi:hypothetical protein